MTGQHCIGYIVIYTMSQSDNLYVSNKITSSIYISLQVYIFIVVIQVDESQWIGDETALNGIQLTCSAPELGDNSFQGVVDSLWGAWGAWRGLQSCEATGQK